MLKIIRKLLFATLIFSMTFVNIAFCVTNGKSEIYDIVYLESDVVDIDFTDEFEKRKLTGLTPNISPYFNSIYYFASSKDQWERLVDYYDRIFFEIIQHDEYFYSLKFKVYYQVSNANRVAQRLVDKKVGDIFPGGYVHLLVEPLDKNGTRAASLIDYIVPEFDFRVVSISPNPNSTNSSLNNNKSSNSSNNSSTDDEFDVEYSFPEDEFTGPGVDTAQNNNSISNTSTNEMTINGTPTNTNSISQSGNLSSNANNITNRLNNNNSVNLYNNSIVELGDNVYWREIIYRDGIFDVDQTVESVIGSVKGQDENLLGHKLGESWTEKLNEFETQYTILRIDKGVLNTKKEANSASTNTSTNVSASANVSTNINTNVNPNDLLILKYGDVIQHTNDVYRNGKYLDTAIGTLELSASNPISEFFVGHICNEQIAMKNVYLKSVVQRFGDGPCDAYYTIKSVNGVPVADLIRQSQALAQSIQAATSQKAINDYTKADTPLVGVNNASQNDDSAILLPSNKSELKDDNHFYLDNNLQKDTWVYDTVYYYYVDKNGDIEKNKWVDNRYVGEDGRMYRSRQTPDGLWVGDNGIVVDINLDLYNSTIEKEVTPDSWYCTNAGLWYYFENDRTTTKKGWFTDSSDNQTYYLDPITGIMQVGWVSIDGKYYYFNDQHENEVNWKETGGGFYESLGKKVKAYGSMFKNEETPDGYFVNENGEYTGKKNTNATGKISWVFVILVILLILIIIIIIFRRLKTKYNKERSVKFERRDN